MLKATLSLCCLAAAFLLFAFPTPALAQDACAPTTPGIQSIQPDGPTRIRVELQAGVACEIAPEGSTPPRAASGGSFVLDLAEAPHYKLSVGNPATECRLDFERIWKTLAPGAAIRFSGTSVASRELEALVAPHGESTPGPYRLLTVAAAAGPQASSPTATCQPRDAQPWSVGSSFSLGDKKLPAFDLLLAPGDSGGGPCYRLGTAVRDDRKVVLHNGPRTVEIDVASWRSAPPPLLIEDTEDPPRCRLEQGSPGGAPLDCDDLTVPALGKLPAFALPSLRYKLRLAGTMAQRDCPDDPGPVGQEIVSLGPKVRLCFYRKGPADGAYRRVRADESPATELQGFRFSVCQSGHDGAACTSAVPAADVIALANGASERAHLHVLAPGAADPLRIELGPLRVFPRLAFEISEPPVEYVGPTDFLNALLSPAAADLLCLAPHGGTPVRGAPPKEYLGLRIGGVNASVPDGWEVRGPRDKLCAKRLTLEGDDVVPSLQKRFDRGDQIIVTYLQNGEPVLERRLRSNRAIHIRAVAAFDAGGTSASLGAMKTEYAIAREPLDLGGWLCVDTLQNVGPSIPVQLSRLGIRDGAGGQRVGKFVSGQNAEAEFVLKGAAGSGGRYCVNLSASEGQYAVRFAPEQTATTANQGALAFSLDDDIRGCELPSGAKVECGRVEADWKYFAVGRDALRFAHIDIGVWRTTDDTTRLRVTPMIPLLDAGLGIPGVLSVALQTGLGVPFTLLADSPTDPNATLVQPEKTFAGIGVGGFVGLCLKAQTVLVPRVCGGAMGDLDADIVQKDGNATELAGTPMATYFVSIGGGLR